MRYLLGSAGPISLISCDSHPTHSLLRFLLASNSLDLILDIVLELWGAIIGNLPLHLSGKLDAYDFVQVLYPLMH